MNNQAKPTLLYLDDEDIVLKVFEVIFGDEYNFIGVQTLKDFKLALKNNDVDIILLDIGLGDSITGFDLTKAIRANEFYKDLPIICVSSYASHYDIINAKKAGVSAFVHKPFNKREIEFEIDNCLHSLQL